MKIIYVIYRGQGMDSGFGDYCSSWESTPMKLNGEILWFNSKEVAEKIAKDLTENSANKFYGAGKSSSYDGYFPVECECREVVVPENSPSDLSSFQSLVDQEQSGWNWNTASGYDTSEEDGEYELIPCPTCLGDGWEDKDLETDCKDCGGIGWY